MSLKDQLERLKVTIKPGEYPPIEDDTYEGLFVLHKGKKIGFIYSLDRAHWVVYGYDLGADKFTYRFRSKYEAMYWVYQNKPGLASATKRRGWPRR